MAKRKRWGSSRQQVVARQSANLPQEVLNQEQLDRQISEKALQRNANSSGNPPDPEPEPAAQNGTEDIQALMLATAQQAAQEAAAKVAAEKDAVIEQLQHQIKETNQQLEAAQGTIATNNAEVEQAQRIVKAMSTLGNPVPVGSKASDKVGANFNTLVGSRWDKCPDSVVTAMSLLEPPNQNSYSKLLKMGKTVQHGTPDMVEFNKYVRENKAHLLNEITQWGKQNGLFRGSSNTWTEQNAATVASDLATGFLPRLLSGLVFQRPLNTLVFHQFVKIKVDFSKGSGDLIKMTRTKYQPKPTSEASRRLSGLGLYVPIDPGAKPIQTGESEIRLYEYGWGGTPETAPLNIVLMVEAQAMVEVLPILQDNLNYDYRQWEDVSIRDYLTATTAIRYNDAGYPTSNSADLSTGDNGTATLDFIYRQTGDMAAKAVPSYENGMYAWVVDPITCANIQTELKDYFSPATPGMMQDITNFLNPGVINPGEVDKVSGYMGNIGNAMVFQTNNWASGVSGDPGVRTETIASASRLLRESLFIGKDCLARGVAMPPQIVMGDDTDYQRRHSFIWKSQEGFAPLDIDAAAYAGTAFNDDLIPQDTRVFKARLLERAI